MQINGNVSFTFWSAMKDFSQAQRGEVTVFLRDFVGSSYTEIASGSLDVTDWQGGASSYVSKTLTIPNVSYTLVAGNQLEIKIVVGENSEDDMWFAYDTVGLDSRLTMP